MNTILTLAQRREMREKLISGKTIDQGELCRLCECGTEHYRKKIKVDEEQNSSYETVRSLKTER